MPSLESYQKLTVSANKVTKTSQRKTFRILSVVSGGNKKYFSLVQINAGIDIAIKGYIYNPSITVIIKHAVPMVAKKIKR